MRVLKACFCWICGVLLAMAVVGPASAQDPKPVLEAQAPAVTQAKAGQEFFVKLTLVINDGFHINSTQPEDDSLLPTRLELKDNPLFKLTGVAWPAPHQRKFPYTDSKIPVYEGKLPLVLHLEAKAGAPVGDHKLTATISFQGCTETACMMPDELDLDIEVRLVP